MSTSHSKGRPILPPRCTVKPCAFKSSEIMVVVVVFPSLPVTAIILHGHSLKKTSISDVTSAPLADAAVRCSSKGMSPGVLKMISKFSSSRYLSPRQNLAPRLESCSCSVPRASAFLLSQAVTSQPRSSSFSISGVLLTPMPITPMRLSLMLSIYSEKVITQTSKSLLL